MGSVWFRNSVRGAAGLALAVLVAKLTNAQNGFWVVLGTISVLRSSALATGTTVVEALTGTVIGIVVGGLIVAALGSEPGLLWAVLPFAVLLGAYSPRAISFTAGQAAFTIVIVVLFNLLNPVGWSVGVVRIEDVAIGCAVSLVTGFLFWPRGAADVLRESIGGGLRDRGALPRHDDRDDARGARRRRRSSRSRWRRAKRRCGSTRRCASTSPRTARRGATSTRWRGWSAGRRGCGGWRG